MGKKKNKKKNAYKSFVEMLKDKQKKIFIMKDEKKISLSDVVDETISEITSVPQDSMIAITSEDAAKKRDAGSAVFETRYAKAPFSIYEYAMKYPKRTQTLVLTLTPAEVEDIFEYNSNENISVLMERTNIGLILKKMDKAKNRLKKWLSTEATEEMETFVLNIPNIVLFTDTLKKDEVSKSVLFNITIQVIKTKPSIKKIKKKSSEKYNEIIGKVIDTTLKTAVSLGDANIHIPVEGSFIDDLKDYASKWTDAVYDTDNEKLLNNIVFSADHSLSFTELANSLIDCVSSKAEATKKRAK